MVLIFIVNSVVGSVLPRPVSHRNLRDSLGSPSSALEFSHAKQQVLLDDTDISNEEPWPLYEDAATSTISN